MKRKYGNRSEWKRVIKKEYTQTYLDIEGFTGYVTLLKIDCVIEPLFVQYGERSVCIVDDGYMWLQHFPSEKHYALTTMFDSTGEIVQWYIDICHSNGIENNNPWLDDLFLDIVVFPTGEIIQLDLDELELALVKGIIDHTLYKLACNEADKVTKLIESDEFMLMNLAKEHKDLLLMKIV